MTYRASSVDTNQSEIVANLRDLGFTVAHCHTVGGGFPDLVVAKNKVTMLVEVKSKGGKLGLKQKFFHAAWADDVCIAYEVDDVVEAYLKKLKRFR